MSGPGLAAQVRALCTATAGALAPGPARELVARVGAKLDEPLRVAVAGSVSAGKSTLVNALLGRRVAEVHAGECTRVVTWYRHGPQERAETVLVDGHRRPLTLAPGGRLPRALEVDPARVAHVEVRLPVERLRTMSIIDTPGLDTVTEANQDAATRLLGLGDGAGKEGRDTRTAMGDADALIYLMPHARGLDADVLAAFQALFRGTGLSAVNAVGVLSKIDRLAGAGRDPWQAARRIATRVAGELRGVVGSVLPVIGLLAETVRTGRLTESDLAVLGGLGALEPNELADGLMSAGEFLDLPDPRSSRADRARLLEALDLYGLRAAVDAQRAGPAGLPGRLGELSGIDALERLLGEAFGRRADLLKAHAGMGDLVRISHAGTTSGDRAVLRALRDPLERLRFDDDWHELRAMDALRAAGHGVLPLPDDLVRDLELLVLGTTPATRLGLWPAATTRQVAEAAAVRARRWGACANDLRRGPDEARLARDVKSAFEALHSRAARPR